MIRILLLLALVAASSQLVLKDALPNKEDYLSLYKSALNFYFENTDYPKSQHYIELALADKRYRDVMLLKCHRRCLSAEVPSSNDLFFYSQVIQEKCTKKCMRELFGEPLELPLWVIQEFKGHKPYSFLQYAYYMQEDLVSALEAATIHLTHNVGNEMMVRNVNFYQSQGADLAAALPHERPDSKTLFLRGQNAYAKEDYAGAFENLKQGLTEHIREVRDCKTLCEIGHDRYEGRKAPNLTASATFTEQLVVLYQRVMECRYKCPTKLEKDTSLKLAEDFLPSLLNYLQFSAFQTGRLEEAAQAAGFYLEIRPGDQQMITNLNYYLDKLGWETASVEEEYARWHSQNEMDKEVLSALVGKREMRKRLQEKRNFLLGDMGMVSDLSPDANVLWRNLY